MFNFIDKAYVAVANKLKKSVSKVSAGDSQLVVALVLIAVAVGLCVIFQAQLRNILNNLLNTVQNKIDTLVNVTNNT